MYAGGFRYNAPTVYDYEAMKKGVRTCQISGAADIDKEGEVLETVTKLFDRTKTVPRAPSEFATTPQPSDEKGVHGDFQPVLTSKLGQ
jgi:hypothetical protein